MPVIATWSPFDLTLGILVPLGLVAAVPTGIVIDLDPESPSGGSTPTLADLVRNGPTRAQLDPISGASAHLPNGGIAASEAEAVISELAHRWPHVVLKCPASGRPPADAIGLVPLLPDPHRRMVRAPVILQRGSYSPPIRPSVPVLPPPRRTTVAALLAGRAPVGRDRWLRALRKVWQR